MHLVPFTAAPEYSAPGHRAMQLRRLQGMEAGPSDFVWIGCSTIEPGGGTASNASDVEKFYVCVEGEVQVTGANGNERRTVTLGPLDSCRISPGESRELLNNSDRRAVLLLVMPTRLTQRNAVIA